MHRKPLSELGFDDIRLLTNENEGLEFLVPIALEKLKEDLLFEAEYYPGDLLKVLLQINDTNAYWSKHPDEKQNLIGLYENQLHSLSTSELNRSIKDAFNQFCNAK